MQYRIWSMEYRYAFKKRETYLYTIFQASPRPGLGGSTSSPKRLSDQLLLTCNGGGWVYEGGACWKRKDKDGGSREGGGRRST